MFTLFRPKPITDQIRQYVAWKAIRHPTTADAHRRVLIEFSKYAKLNCTSQIDAEGVSRFVEMQSSEHYRQLYTRALRAYILYWRKQGLLVRRFDSLIGGDIVPIMHIVSPRMNVDAVRRVQQLRATEVNGKPMKFRTILEIMEKEDKRKYDIAQIYRWYRYKLPELSPHSR